jgi:MFS superfamily sulfate permease-like transporter
VPGPLVAVFTAALINQLFHMNFPDLALRAEDGRLVTLPEISSLGALVGELRRPDFSLLTSGAVWMVAFTIAAVASIETLLCIESTDKLDPQKRISNTNRELFAQGVGNMLSGLVGGLPMTSVIVRSSANIYAGARSRMSAIYHGCFLLLSAVALASILNLIPLAALAAVLITVGYKLAHPKLFKSLYAQGMNQFVPFAVTIIAILFTDLLKGVLIGLAVGVVFVIKASFYSAILTIRDGKDILIRFTKDATFIHKIKLRRDLGLAERGDHVFFDGSRAMYIDHDVYEMIQHFVETAPDRGITVELKDVQVRRPQVKLAIWEKQENGVLQEAVVGQPRLGP